MSGARAIVLAPQRPPSGDVVESIGKLLAKADRLAQPSPDDRSMLGDLFQTIPHDSWPVAALTRAHEAGDASDIAWVRADPAHLRVELANVRLLACGDIGQSREQADALVAMLAPVFGDEGFELSAPHPQRWYLRAFAGNAASDLPDLPPPERALGGDLFEMWPEDVTHRRWRRFFNETQILLAQHPVNHHRFEHGLPAINGLWFWGAGRLPAAINSAVAAVMTEDILLSSLAQMSNVRLVTKLGDALTQGDGDVLLDLRNASSIEGHLLALLDNWRCRSIRAIEWRTPEWRWILKPWHRWRFWS